MKKLALAVLLLALSVPLNAQVIISDDFSSGTPGSTLIGSTTPVGNATYGGFVDRAVANYSNFSDPVFPTPNADMYALDSGGLAYVNLSTNLASYNAYTLNFGVVRLTGLANSGYTLLQGRATSINLGFGFQLSINGDGNTDIKYVAAEGSTPILMGTYEGGNYLPNLSLHVVGNTQQLFIDGTAFGSAQGTQGTFGGAASGLAWATQGLDGDQQFRFDNLTVTVVPEPSTCVMLMLGITAVGIYYRRRRA